MHTRVCRYVHANIQDPGRQWLPALSDMARPLCSIMVAAVRPAIAAADPSCSRRFSYPHWEYLSVTVARAASQALTWILPSAQTILFHLQITLSIWKRLPLHADILQSGTT